MATSSQGHANQTMTPGDHEGGIQVPIVVDACSFENRQALKLKEMERRHEDSLKRRRKQWEKQVERMRGDFLHLFPVVARRAANVDLDRNQRNASPLVTRRKGSTDVLDIKKVREHSSEFSRDSKHFRLRYDLSGFDPNSIAITVDQRCIVVRATRLATATGTEDGTGDAGIQPQAGEVTNGQPSICQNELHHHRHHHNIQKQQPQEYVSKIERPADVDLKHVKAYLSTDSVLTLEAQLPPRTHSPVANTDHLPKGSPSHGPQQALHDSRSNSPASRSRSGSTCGSPAKGAQTGTSVKIGAPTFFERDGVRQLSLTVDLGGPFKASEVAVHVVKENRLLVKARHEECTTERMVKSKFCREYELAEKIEPFSTRAGLAEDRHILVIGALTKMHIAACLVAASTGGSGTCSGSSNCTPVASKKRVPPPPLPLSIAKSPKSSMGNLQESNAKEAEEGQESQAPPPADVIQLPTNVIPCIVINLAAFPPKEVSD